MRYKKFLTLLLVLLFGCQLAEKPKPIRIGFVGVLSGHNAEIGDHCRDAALLAVEQVNRQGGIAGRKIELVVKDLQGDPAGKKIVKELLDTEVDAIIGPMFSSNTVALSPLLAGSDVVMLSPTAGTTQLNGLDDNLLRLYPGSDVTTRLLAEYMTSEGITTVAIVRDEINSTFTKNWEEHFSRTFQQLGGQVLYSGSYMSGRDLYMEVASRASRSKPQAFLLLATPIETALLCQQLNKIGNRAPIFTSEWSVSNELISGGGKTVEGMRFFHAINIASREENFLAFKEAYRKHYRADPIFPAILTYDAANVLFYGIEKALASGKKLKPTLLEQKAIKLLQTSITFDRFGDIEREFFLTTIRDGEFRVLSRE